MKAATPRPRTPTIPAWGAWCFLASGAAALIYEVVWFKQLSYLLGNSLHAVATVVAAFLAGLALGARFLGTPLARRGEGARMYGLLELGVGLIGLVSMPGLRALDPVIGTLYQSLGGEGTAFGFARLGLMFVLLVPPAALMGATLPVLVAHFERGKLGPGLARLYAINTFGAVVGSVTGGFLLLPNLGLLATTWVAAGLNFLVALVSWRAAGPRAAPVAREAAREAEVPPMIEGAITGGARAVFAFAFALSGFAALAFQIAWVRLFSLTFGSSVYSFAAVLGIYLTGLALGAAAASGLLRRGVRLADFARLELALAVLAALMLQAFQLLPQWMYELVERSGTNWGAVMIGEMMLVAALILVPCALLGAVFPVATRLLQVRDGGHAAGLAYAVNTAGTIAGSLVAGFVLVPTFGVQGTHLTAVAVTMVTGLVVLGLARMRRESTGAVDLAWGASAVVVAGALAFMAPRWDPALMSAGLFRPIQARTVSTLARQAPQEARAVWRATRDERVLFYRDGINGSVLVATDPMESARWLRVGGKVDASTNDMETQVLIGLIPAMLADSGARTLVIGHGSGITAAAVLAGGAGPTEIIEIEPHVIEASRFFHAPGEDPLDDPRVKVILGDARTHLLHAGRRYDVIVSEPTNPWISGVNSLFTVDFYRRVRDRLEPGGVFGQWMQLYELSPETFRSLVASLIEVFPEGQVFAVWRAVDVLFVVVPPDRRLAVERLDTPAGARMLERAQIPSVDALAAYYAGPFAAMRSSIRQATLNRDDRPYVEYRAPRDVIEVGRAALFGDPQVMALLPFAEGPPEGPLFAAWPADRWYEARAHFLAQQGDVTRAMMTVRYAREAGFPESADRLKVEVEALERRRQSAEAFDRSRMLSQSNPTEALAALETAVEIDPTHIRAWLVLGDKRRQAGDLDGAEAALAQAGHSKDPGILAEVAIIGGLIEIARGHPSIAAERFREAQRLTPDRAKPYALEARARYASGDAAGAADALQRGLAAVPNDPELVATQKEMSRQR